MTLFSTLIEETRNLISPIRRDTIDKLSGAIDADGTTVTVTYGENVIGAGKRLSIDMEDLHVWAGSGKSASAVERGVNGSSASTHADGAVVYVDSSPSTYEIGRAINRKLAALPGEGVFAFPEVTLTGSATLIGYDLTGTTNLVAVHRVRYDNYGPSDDWPIVKRDQWRLDQAANNTDFPSGMSLMVYDDVPPGRTINVTYKAAFTALNLTTAGLAQDATTISGLPDYAVPLLSLGAAILLTAGRPTERAAIDAQGQTRRPQEVTTSDTRLAASPLQVEYQQTLRRVKAEQIRRYGP